MSLPSALPPAHLAWVNALREPQTALAWTEPQWQRVVRLARRLRLLARLAEALQAAGLLDQVPALPRRHLIAEQHLSRSRTAAVCWTMNRVGNQLSGAAYPRVLLKGAAYIAQGLDIGAGRLPADLDILVPHTALDGALARLQAGGWKPQELDAHDQRFYMEWSHEAPPMTHPLHPVELDLHHAILPPVARTHVDMALLLERLQPSGWPGWQVLCPPDQLLHSASHLFFDSDLRDRLRDIVDLDALMRQQAALNVDFWPQLWARARQLGLTEPLALALHFTTRWLGTPAPAALVDEAMATLPLARRTWLLPVLECSLMPAEPDEHADRLARQFSDAALLLRYQRYRLPLRLLLPHVWHKLQVRRDGGEEMAQLGPPPR